MTEKHEFDTPEKTVKPSRRAFIKTAAAGSAAMFLAGRAAAQEEAAATAAASTPGEQAAASAPVSTPEPASISAPPPGTGGTDNDINIAIIGLGAQGSVLMDAILRIPNIRVKAVCDIWEYSSKRAAGMLRKFGHEVTVYEDYREMLAQEKDLQAAVVATPDFMHAEHAIACMRAGLHVYCEKEMSNDIEKARQMVITKRETGKLLQIGHQRRSNPRYRHAIDNLLLKEHLIGRVTHANAQWNRAKSDDLGWPKKYEIDPATLAKYGYDSMQHFRNWRWYKKYGGGPIVDLGSHQIDIFNWVFGTRPRSVMAGGGVDFYNTHEWYDNVLAIYDFESANGVGRAFYQVLTTSSNGGFYETFMGVDGSLVMSEVAMRGNRLLKEAHADEALWNQMADHGWLEKPVEPKAAPTAAPSKDVLVDVRVSKELGAWNLPIQLNKPVHQPHLENFFDAIRHGIPLNCPAEIGFETAVCVLKANEAVASGTRIFFRPEEFEV